MPLMGLPSLSKWETLGAEGDTLVELDITPDDTCLANDDTRTVVNREILTDVGTGVDVDTCLGVSKLGHEARDEGHAHETELVSDTIVGEATDDGVAGDDLCMTVRRRVTVVSRYDIGSEDTTDLRQTADELARDVVRLHRQVTVGNVHRIIIIIGDMAETQTGKHLVAEQVIHSLDVDADLVLDGMEVDL